MSKPVYLEFYNNLLNVLSTTTTSQVKFTIGDSTNNNRVPTASQIVRFLFKTGHFSLASELYRAVELLRREILAYRNNERSDALDIYEFLDYYQDVLVLNGTPDIRRVVGRALTGRALAA